MTLSCSGAGKVPEGPAKRPGLPGLRELKAVGARGASRAGGALHQGEGDPKLARKAGIFLCRKFSEQTLAEIARFYGGTSVSAVSQTVQRLASQRQRDKQIDKQLRDIEKKTKMWNVWA